MAFSNIKRIVAVVWCFVETLLFGGIVYGWGSLVFILKDEGVYSHLCTVSTANHSEMVGNNGTTNNCESQDSMMTLIFTVTVFAICVGCVILGQINFKFGTRVTRLTSFVLFECGALMIALVSPSIPHLIFPGLGFVGIGGISLLVTNTQISYLFVTGSSTVVGLIGGAFDASSFVQLIVKVAYEMGFTRQNSYYIIMGLHCSVLLSTFAILPKGFIPKPQTIEIHGSESDCQTKKDEGSIYVVDSGSNSTKLSSDEDHGEQSVPKAEGVEKKSLPTLKNCLFSYSYVLHVLWVSVLQLRFFCYLSSFNPWLLSILDGDKTHVSYFTNIAMYLQFSALITSPLVGVVYDFYRKIFSKSRSDLRRNLMPAVPPLIIGSGLGILLSVLVLIPSTGTLYLLFVTVTIYRSFLYSMAAAFLSSVFPVEYFGLLYGIQLLIAGVVGFFQFALFKWSEVTNFNQVNIFLLVFMFISLIHPLYQWRKCHKAEVSVVKELNI